MKSARRRCGQCASPSASARRPSLRTVYLGTSAFGAAVLEWLAHSDHRPQLVLTRPDRPRGRGRRLASPPVAEVARRLGIDLEQPEDVNGEDSRARIAAQDPDAVLICAFGAMIGNRLLASHQVLNVHPSLLPRWRGAAPIERAIEAGDRETGVSIMRPVAEVDAGPVCLARPEPIRADDDFGALSARLERLAGELLVEALDTRPPFREQPAQGVTLARKISAGDRRLDPAERAVALERRVRALSPHIGAYLELGDGERLGVLRARALSPEEGLAEPVPPPAGASGDGRAGAAGAPAPGKLAAGDDRLVLGCADGALELEEVKPPGGRAMDASAYLRGHGAGIAGPPGRAPQ